MFQVLYTYPDNFRAHKILIAAEYSGANVKVISEPPEFLLGQTNKTEEFLSKFPLGKVSEKALTAEVQRQSTRDHTGTSL